MQDSKYVILTIDDNPDFLQAIRLFLEANGYIVVEAKSAEEGLNVYKKDKAKPYSCRFDDGGD